MSLLSVGSLKQTKKKFVKKIKGWLKVVGAATEAIVRPQENAGFHLPTAYAEFPSWSNGDEGKSSNIDEAKMCLNTALAISGFVKLLSPSAFASKSYFPARVSTRRKGVKNGFKRNI